MSANDLIKKGLFAEDPDKKNKKFSKTYMLPEEINYKREQYKLYKNIGKDKISFMEQMLIRVAFICEWNKYKSKTIQVNIFNLSCFENIPEIFKAIVLLLWCDKYFSTDDLYFFIDNLKWLQKAIYKDHPQITNKSSVSYGFEDILDISEPLKKTSLLKENSSLVLMYINHLSQDLLRGVYLDDYEKNAKYIKTNFFQPAIKVKSIEDSKKIPDSNILISLDPMSETKILKKSIAKIIHQEKQRLAKNAQNRDEDILFDKEYDSFVEDNILFFMDIYLYTEVFHLTFTDELWAKLFYNIDKFGIGNKKDHIVNNCRKKRENFIKNILQPDYASKLQRKLRTEILLHYKENEA